MFIHLSSSLNGCPYSFIHDTAIRESSTHICTGTNPTDTHPCMRARTHTVCSCWGDCELRFKNKSSQKASGSLTTWNLCIRHHWSRGTSVKEHRQLIGRPRRADRWPLPRRLHPRDLDSVSLSHCANVSHTQTPSHTGEALLIKKKLPTRLVVLWIHLVGGDAEDGLPGGPRLHSLSLPLLFCFQPRSLPLSSPLLTCWHPPLTLQCSFPLAAGSGRAAAAQLNAAGEAATLQSGSKKPRRYHSPTDGWGERMLKHTHRCTHTLESWHNERVCSGFVRVRGRRCFNRPDWRVITQICWETAAEGIWRF